MPRAAVVVPGGVNYFYDQAGRRIAAALGNRGVGASVYTLREVPDAEFDYCVLVNLFELGVGYGQQDAALRRIRQLLARTGQAVAVAIDCVRTHWFAQTLDLCRRAGVATIVDLGFHDQQADLPPDARPLYRFAFNGLTEQERRALDRSRAGPDGRPLPWVFVGHHSAGRAALVDRLVREFHPGGFVYLPRLAAIADGGPHLNEQQFQRLLSRSRLQVWRSHHDYFYMESERFRNSALAGCLPVKIVGGWEGRDPSLPFRHLLVEDDDVASRLRALDPTSAWERFADEFRRYSLEDSMAAALAAPRPAGER